MKPFIHEDYLLVTETARRLYHEYAEQMPVIDYHCHLSPKEISEDRRWDNMTQLWLGGDHYKWRQMRANGVSEEYCTGDAPDYDKFLKYAETMDYLLRSPLFDWTQLELARYFGVYDRFCSKSTPAIWEECNAQLAQPGFSARQLMERSNVRVVCTTDDPVDSLEYHRNIAASGFGVKVLPTWRSDMAAKVWEPHSWNRWVNRLSEAAGMEIDYWEDFLEALEIRRRHFKEHGCLLSDYGVTEIVAEPYSGEDICRIFEKIRSMKSLDPVEIRKFQTAWLYEGLMADAEAGWTAQIHFGCMRNNNSRMYREVGADSGFDSIGEYHAAVALNRLFSWLDSEGRLPKCILYAINPNQWEMLGSLIGNFQQGPVPSHLQLGAAWWFNDHRDGMIRHLEVLSQTGVLGRFIGMLTDSRSFVSYARHEYFRRILCGKLGEEMERGIIPSDIEWVGGLVRDICYNNAERYLFGTFFPSTCDSCRDFE